MVQLVTKAEYQSSPTHVSEWQLVLGHDQGGLGHVLGALLDILVRLENFLCLLDCLAATWR